MKLIIVIHANHNSLDLNSIINIFIQFNAQDFQTISNHQNLEFFKLKIVISIKY